MSHQALNVGKGRYHRDGGIDIQTGTADASEIASQAVGLRLEQK